MKPYTFQHGNKVFRFDGTKTEVVSIVPLALSDKDFYMTEGHWHYGVAGQSEDMRITHDLTRDLKLDAASQIQSGRKGE